MHTFTKNINKIFNYIPTLSPIYIPFIIIHTIILQYLFFKNITAIILIILLILFIIENQLNSKYFHLNFNTNSYKDQIQSNSSNHQASNYQQTDIQDISQLIQNCNKIIHNLKIILISILLGILTCYLNKPIQQLYGHYYIKGKITNIQLNATNNQILTIKTASFNSYIKITTSKWQVNQIARIGDTILGEIYIYKNKKYSNINYGKIITKLHILHSSTDLIDNIRNKIFNIRSKIYEICSEYHDNEINTFLTTLLIGAYKKFDNYTQSIITQTGLSHILCISGLHISLIFYIISYFFRIFLHIIHHLLLNIKINTRDFYTVNIKTISFIFATILTGIYVIFTGLEISAIRAYLMTIYFVITHIYLGFTIQLKNISFILICMLMYNPYYIYDISFQLSFAAILAISIYQQQRYNENNIINQYNSTTLTSNSYINYLISYFKLYYYISIFTFPITLYHFNTISLLSFISNFIILPIISYIIMPITCILLALIPFYNNIIFTNILHIQKYCINHIIYIIEMLNYIPYIQIQLFYNFSNVNLYIAYCILSTMVLINYYYLRKILSILLITYCFICF